MRPKKTGFFLVVMLGGVFFCLASKRCLVSFENEFGRSRVIFC